MAMAQAMQEKELIALVTELVKYRQEYGQERFKALLAQMQQLIVVNKETGQ